VVELPHAVQHDEVARPHVAIATCSYEAEQGGSPWEVRRAKLTCAASPHEVVTIRADASDTEGWRHFLDYADVDGVRWTANVIAPVGLALRTDGGIVVLDLKQGATLLDRGGHATWHTQFPYCGAVEDVAVGFDDAITFSCGYSLVRLDRMGMFQWQHFPFGNVHTHGPWVDRVGTLYVTGRGDVAALNADGTERWKFSTGFNRNVHTLGWLPNGNMTFVTSMDELHTSGRLHIYHLPEPQELFELTRGGAVVRRDEFTTVPAEWPRTWPVPTDRAHRLADR
jgi:hypothetical protein